MKKIVFVVVLSTVVATAAPGYAFLDYLFGGAQTSDAIGNSVVGDLRAWWTGNPVYQFNPYYSGSPNPGQQSGGMQGQAGNMQGSSPYRAPQGSYQPQQQPRVTYFPPQAQQGGYAAYGQRQPTYGAPGGLQQYQQMPQQYQQMPQQYQQQPQYQYQQAAPYQQVPQAYQQVPQAYQQVPQYQAGPQAYQNPGMYGR